MARAAPPQLPWPLDRSPALPRRRADRLVPNASKESRPSRDASVIQLFEAWLPISPALPMRPEAPLSLLLDYNADAMEDGSGRRRGREGPVGRRSLQAGRRRIASWGWPGKPQTMGARRARSEWLFWRSYALVMQDGGAEVQRCAGGGIAAADDLRL